MVAELSVQADAVQRGDLARAETMLIAQAHSLDAIFAKLAELAMRNFGDHFDAGDRFMRLALKAQSQSRATLETLSTIKNSPVVIAKQANVTTGPQQVNNGVAREFQTKPNELLERSHGQWLDGAAAGQASGSDLAMATVGALNRAKDG